MVTTLNPNASETPTRPIPTCGKAAAITALPHPAKVSQKVPIASAAYFWVFMSDLPCVFLGYQSLGTDHESSVHPEFCHRIATISAIFIRFARAGNGLGWWTLLF